MASPLKIIIDASDGASDYGNKFGEPMIQVLYYEEFLERLFALIFSTVFRIFSHVSPGFRYIYRFLDILGMSTSTRKLLCFFVGFHAKFWCSSLE